MTITLNSIPYPKDTVEVEYFGEDSVYLRINEVEGMTGTLTAIARVSADALRNALDEAEAQLLALTARELLELAWDQAIVPEDGVIHAGEVFLSKTPHESLASVYGPATTSRSSGAEGAYERRLLDPRPEPARHPKTQEIPHPLTADDINDEMVERACGAFWAFDGGAGESMRPALVAALTEPTRPEGAEDIQEFIVPVQENPRPLTADELDDEAIRRARVAWLENAQYEGCPSAPTIRAMFAAALTPPPSRPEGAEELQALIDGHGLEDREIQILMGPERERHERP